MLNFEEYTYHQKVLKLMMSYQAMMLVSTTLGQHHLPICLSSSMFPLNQQKRTIKEEL